MKKLLLLLLIVLSVLSVTKGQAQTLNWAKGLFDNGQNFRNHWFHVTSDNKFFYQSSKQSDMEYIGMYDVKSGNLIRKLNVINGRNHYIINDSTIIRFATITKDSSTQLYINYDKINVSLSNYQNIFSTPFLYKDKKIKLDQVGYLDFISDNNLIIAGKWDDRRVIIFWDIKNKFISNVIDVQEELCNYTINSLTYDETTKTLFCSNGFEIIQYDCLSRNKINSKEINEAFSLSISNNHNYLAFKYYKTDEQKFKIGLLNVLIGKINTISNTTPNLFDVPIAISQNSNLIAYAKFEYEFEIYDILADKKTTYKTPFFPHYIHFLNNEELLISSESQGFTVIYDIMKKRQTKTLVANESLMREIKYSHDGTKIAVLGYDYLKVLDAETGNMLNCFNINYDFEGDGKYCDINFSKDDNKIIYARDINGFIICDLETNIPCMFYTKNNIISACYSNIDSDIIAIGSSDGSIEISDVDGKNVIHQQTYTNNVIYKVMFQENSNDLYYIVMDPNTYDNRTFSYNILTKELSEIEGLKFGIKIDLSVYGITTYFDRYICSRDFTYDVVTKKKTYLNTKELPEDIIYKPYCISYGGNYSTFMHDVNFYSEKKDLFCNFYQNDAYIGDKYVKSVYSTDYIPYISGSPSGMHIGLPYYPVISPDNKTLILGLDCGSIISLNIENLTPVEDDVKLTDRFRIVNVENKDTYLNCEISSDNEFDSFDYYIYDLSGKLLNQGALGTVGQGSNTITINYTKKMLYPAILLVKSRVNNTYQSKLFY